MFIPDPNFFHPGSELSPSRILIKEFKYFNPKKPKKLFLSSKKYYPGCSSRIPVPDADFLPIPDPGSRISDPGVKKAPNPGSRIRIRNTGSANKYCRFKIRKSADFKFFLMCRPSAFVEICGFAMCEPDSFCKKHFAQCRVSDPDPHWSTFFELLDPNPDPVVCIALKCWRFLYFYKNVFFDIFSHEKKFLTGLQDNRIKVRRKKITLKSCLKKLPLNSQKRSGSGSALKSMRIRNPAQCRPQIRYAGVNEIFYCHSPFYIFKKLKSKGIVRHVTGMVRITWG